MKFRALVIDPIGIGAAIGAGLLATLTLLPQARGELVYEEPDQGPVEIRAESATHDARSEDRRYLRQALTTSEKARATRAAEAARAQPELPQPQLAQPQYVQPAPQPYLAQPVAQPAPVTVGEAAIVTAPATVADPATTPVENLSKTELMRRERTREELRNEDAIQERLEQLRLRDERRRGTQILGSEGMLPAEQVPPPPAPGQSAGVAPLMGEEVVVPPVTERPGQPAQLPAGVNPAAAQTQVRAESTADAKDIAAEDEEKTQLYVRPYAGVGNMKTDAAFNVKPHYSAGVGVGVVSSENVSFELGYTYSDYGIAIASSNPYVAQIQVMQQYQGYANPETIGLKQNVFDAGVKISLLGQNSRIRPFLGGGGGYSKNYVNYAQGYTQALDQYGLQALANDYESSAFLGFLSTGFDIRVSKQLTLGGQFKYYGVFSSRENQQLNFNGFYQNPYWIGSLDADKRAVGASLSESAFYTIQGTASFVF